jgi:predicted small metal-binding protein
MTKHFIDFDNLSFEVLQDIIDHAIALKKEHNEGAINNSLLNKTLVRVDDLSKTIARVLFKSELLIAPSLCSFLRAIA